MQRPELIGQILRTVVPRLDVGGDVPSPGVGGIGEWVVTLTSVLAVLAVGGAAARVARRLARRSTPELIVLLNQSAEFYSRWPEHRLAGAPRGDVLLEAARCGRIIELLVAQDGPAPGGGPATRGPIDGLRAWVALLHSRIAEHVDAAAGPAYA
jgi:hypothetical protein